MQLKDSKTYANLLAAFAGESQARCKYQMYAKKAKKDGYEQISAIFEETSDNEYAHAYQWYKYIQGGQVADTQTNLEDAAKGENYEWTQMYKEFAQVAREEGFNEIATHFELVAQIEAEHEQRYQKLCQNIKDQKVFKKDDSQTVWVCRFCGREHVGPQAPGVCPVCKHSIPRAIFRSRRPITKACTQRKKAYRSLRYAFSLDEMERLYCSFNFVKFLFDFSGWLR